MWVLHEECIAIPFLDHVISNMDDQFTSLASNISPWACTHHSLHQKCGHHQSPWDVPEGPTMPADKWPATAAAAVKECDPVHFLSIRTLLELACTLPVTSCECDHSPSTLKRLSTYMHASMGQEKLTSLVYTSAYPLQHKYWSWQSGGYIRSLHPRKIERDSLIKL